jgi:hypothetical protein
LTGAPAPSIDTVRHVLRHVAPQQQDPVLPAPRRGPLRGGLPTIEFDPRGVINSYLDVFPEAPQLELDAGEMLTNMALTAFGVPPALLTHGRIVGRTFHEELRRALGG